MLNRSAINGALLVWWGLGHATSPTSQMERLSKRHMPGILSELGWGDRRPCMMMFGSFPEPPRKKIQNETEKEVKKCRKWIWQFPPHLFEHCRNIIIKSTKILWLLFRGAGDEDESSVSDNTVEGTASPHSNYFLDEFMERSPEKCLEFQNIIMDIRMGAMNRGFWSQNRSISDKKNPGHWIRNGIKESLIYPESFRNTPRSTEWVQRNEHKLRQ